MKTYVKISGDSKEEALERLRKIAINIPNICVFDSTLQRELATGTLRTRMMSFFGGSSEITQERCASIISTSEIDLGENDFAYEWTSKPSQVQIEQLEKDIKTTLDPLKLKYAVVSN